MIYKRKQALKDENQKYSMLEDFNYIDEQIKLRGAFKVCSIFIQFIFVVFLIANLWAMLVLLVHDDEPGPDG